MSSFHSRTATCTFRTRGQLRGQPRQLVIVRREEDLRPRAALVEVLGHRPRDREAVEGGRAPPDLVEEDEAPRGGVPEDGRRLRHLHEERAVAARQVVLGADAREDAVHHPDPRAPGGHEAPHLGQQHDERRLPHVGRLPGHVRPRDHEALDLVRHEPEVVRHEPRALGPELEHRVAALLDVDDAAVVDDGPDVAALARHVSQRRQHVERRHRLGGAQEPVGLAGDGAPELVEELVLEAVHPPLGAQDLRLLLAELRRHVALGPDQRLAPHVVLGHGPHLALRDLDPVAEHAVVPDPERRDPRALALPPLEPRDPGARLPHLAPQLGEGRSSRTRGSARPRGASAAARPRGRPRGSSRGRPGPPATPRTGGPAGPGRARRSRGAREGAGASREAPRGPAARPPRGPPGSRAGPGRRSRRAPARRSARSAGASTRAATASSRSPISRGRRSGRRSHWRRSRPPIDVRVRSIAQRSVATPPRSWRLSTSSRFRAALSSRVRWSSSASVWMRVRCASAVC